MRSPMIGNRMRAFAVATAFATLAFAAPALASPFDGSWKMVLTTTNGHCGIINIGVAVNGGHISATSGRFVTHKVFLNGQIWGSGKTKINGVAGPRQAVGTARSRRPRAAANGTDRAFGRLLGRLGRRPRYGQGSDRVAPRFLPYSGAAARLLSTARVSGVSALPPSQVSSSSASAKGLA